MFAPCAVFLVPLLVLLQQAHTSSSFTFTVEDEELSDTCLALLRLFTDRYVSYSSCLLSNARPVRVCQNCYLQQRSLDQIYRNISSNQPGAGNVSCSESLLRSDRLMLVVEMYQKLREALDTSFCSQCVGDGGPFNDTLYFLTVLNGTLSCFDSQKGNGSDLCTKCKENYSQLNEIYSNMEKNHTLCIDLEDAMNTTRHLWSKKFNCSSPREETVPVIAVSSFMVFLPVIFYLSSFLHSEQKKRKLIHPKRAKSTNSLMNIQDKQS